MHADTMAAIREMAAAGGPKVSQDLIIRTILDQHIRQIKANARSKIDSTSAPLKIDIDLRELPTENEQTSCPID
jgi:hypothetical protein